ncbi:MAG: hydrogenase maturation protein [Oligoflexia bacterium]|nr:hydrogenase maturation protein [Oligoflexia bacterium]
MRILFLTHSFNSLAQRLFVELTARSHEVSIEFDINDEVTTEAIRLFSPDLVIAPFLKRAIPEAVWRGRVCLVVHPGVVGDRGPSSLDWAILEGEREWGVTVLQAEAEMDAGPVWASETFPLRAAPKSSLYRNEVTEAAVRAVLRAVENFASGAFRPESPDLSRTRGRLRPAMRQADRAIDWAQDTTERVLRKIRASDGTPGVLDPLCGGEYFLHGAWRESRLRGGEPGAILAQRDGAICRATRDGAVWITHLRRKGSSPELKLPATLTLGASMPDVPEAPVADWNEIHYEERAGVGYLHFPFANGAMGTEQCRRLRAAYLDAVERDTRVLVLMGGTDFWSNGIHLNLIEAAASPADESWQNINAMNDLVRAILDTPSKITVSALQGNAGAGGVFLALAADQVLARTGVILNPHYKSMGNLFGSEYWTYLLPRRVSEAQARAITQNRLPIGAPEAKASGLIDDHFGADVPGFASEVRRRAETLASDPRLAAMLAEKSRVRAQDEERKPLESYRAEELERMKLNFYGFDPSYHVARYNFVFRVPHSWTPLHLALHRRNVWEAREASSRAQAQGS